MRFLSAPGTNITDTLSGILQSDDTSAAGTSAFWENFESWDSLAAFYQKYQVVLILSLAALCLVTCFVIYIRRKLRKKQKDPLKELGAGGFFKTVSAILILLLALSDLFAMYNMFSSFRLRLGESVIFSITFAAFLEGFPFALGLIDPLKQDPAQFIMARGKRYRAMSRMCWSFLIISWALALGIRFLFTQQPVNGGFMAFWGGKYNHARNPNANNSYLAQVFLFVSPILTSVLAYALSYLAFGSSCLEQAQKIMRAAHARCQAAQEAYDTANHDRLDAINTLWSSLTRDSDAPPPYDFEDFRNQSIVYIHDMLINGCLDAYPGLLKRYNHEVEAALARYIVELSGRSTVPQLINQITVRQITDEYDAHMIRDVDKWEYELCEPAMCADLEQLLHDAVIGAQFRNLPKK